jgi:hypothetical protein
MEFPSGTQAHHQLSYRSGDIWSLRLDTYEPLQVEMESFLEAARAGKVGKSDGKTGLAVVRALEAAEESLKNQSRMISIG